eukprot:GFUD01055058.1.p1 GENE.GFUD01055058.1~~GFUD01055058.1.p1  ORF type:complete len:494 (-),score=83.58 GFUD01055058.1:98-1372(-)
MAYHFTMLCGGYGKYKQRNSTNNKDPGENNANCFSSFATQIWLHLSYPINRFIAHTLSYIFFLIFLVLVSENPEDEEDKLDPDWYDIAAVVMAMGFFVSEMGEFVKRYKGKNFSFWNIFDIACYLTLLVSNLAKAIGYWMECKTDAESDSIFGCTLDLPHKYGENSVVVVSYSLFGVGLTLTFSKLLYFCQISHKIGPIAISIKRVCKDIILVAISFLIFLIAFGLGIFYLMKNVNDEDVEEECKHQLHDTTEVFKTLFWNLFDPASIEDFGCRKIKGSAPRYLAMFLFAMFLIFNFLILMNALIALMNSTLNAVNMNKVQQWKFERTSIWLRYLDLGFVLPCPFNLIEVVVKMVKTVFRKCRSPEDTSHLAEKSETKRYMELVEELSKRYLLREEDSDTNDITREDIENHKHEIINFQKRVLT